MVLLLWLTIEHGVGEVLSAAQKARASQYYSLDMIQCYLSYHEPHQTLSPFGPGVKAVISMPMTPFVWEVKRMSPSFELIKLYAHTLRLPTLATCQNIIRQAEETGLSYEDFLSAVLFQEIQQREENQQKQRVKHAHFPLEKYLDSFEWKHLVHVKAVLIWQLASGGFLKRKENVIMIGNPGTGKTHLAIGLGRRLCSQGFKVRYAPAANIATELVEAQEDRTLKPLEKTLLKVDILILDEVSCVSFTRAQGEPIFRVLSERNEHGSVIITTNLEFSLVGQKCFPILG